MNSAIIIMTILGCGQAADACEYIRTVETRFATSAACEAHSEAELLKTPSGAYPDTVALCEPLPAVTVGLPSGEQVDPLASQEPTIVYAPVETRERPNPLRWAALRTRQVANGIGQAIGNSWRVMTGRKRHDAEPILLGRYASSG